MCGLFGYITKQGKHLDSEQKRKRAKIAIALGIAMETRGEDSTGIALIGGVTDILKATQKASEFLPKLENKIADQQHNILIGHARFATVGAIKHRNAHPFKFGKIVGSHNGSVDNYLDFDHKGEVDSEVIFSELEKHEGYKNVLKKLSGSFALTWYNSEKNKFFMARNSNPLATAYVKEIETIFWVSIDDFLPPILSTQFDISKIDFNNPSTNTCYEISQDLTIKGRKINFKERASYYQNYGYSDEYYKREYTDGYDYEDIDDFERCAYCGDSINFKELVYFSEDESAYFCKFCGTHAQADGFDVTPINIK